MNKQPFTIDIDKTIINDLKERLANTRWPDEINNFDWGYGTNLLYLQQLCSYWQNDFDWPKNETYLNGLHHYTTSIDDKTIHFIHEKGKGKNSFPLLLTHGFPDSFYRFVKTIPLLTEADDAGFSFDVIIPSIPGFGFSYKPSGSGTGPQKIAALFVRLLTEELGYEKFFAHGGDWGSSITECIALDFPKHLHGIHLTDIPYHHLFSVPAGELTEPEKKYLERGRQWQMTEGGYGIIQSTKPQTVTYGLNDSPSGLAAWIVEKFKTWSDCDTNLEECFTKDELLTNLTIYWATETIGSAMRIYKEAMMNPVETKDGKIEMPTGVAIFPKDIVPAPKEYADRIYNIQQWTEMPHGGHFAAMEQTRLLTADIRKFAKKLLHLQ